MLTTRTKIHQVWARPDKAHQRHHQFFADRIDGRIRDLREILEKIIGEHSWLVGERGERDIAAHGANRVLALHRHRIKEELHVFPRVTKCLLHIEQGLTICRHRTDFRRQVGKMNLGLVEPLLIWIGIGQIRFEFLVGDDPVLF